MTGLIILAAGKGSRFGQPKQNLIFKNKTLLQSAITTAKSSFCRPIIVVTGAYADLINPNIENSDVSVVYNSEWEEGMASSIRIGVETIKAYQDIDSVLIMLCDQPLVTPLLISEMLHKQHTSGKAIVCCSYNNTVGVPVLFQHALFNELLLLKGQEGAKKILKNHPDDVATVLFDGGSLDIDTPEDYERLIKDYEAH